MFSVLGGLSIPTGDFASRTGQSAGYAAVGFSAASEYVLFLTKIITWQISASFSYNSMNQKALLEALGSPTNLTLKTGSYLTLCPSSGFGFITNSDDVSLFASGQLGILFGATPEISATYGGSTATQKPASGKSLAGMFSIGIITSKNMVVTIRYLTGKPAYTVTSVGTNTSITNSYEQSTSMLFVLIGFGF